MYPDDRVLVGVINRKRDLDILLRDHWYRIPQEQAENGIYTEYLAFFLSGAAARRFDCSGIHYYALRAGVELAYRRDLLPDETSKKAQRLADKRYYQVQFKTIEPRQPPITNPNRRPVSFIYTTWDRFVNAATIADLYSRADYFVDRIYHALRDKRLRVNRYWDAGRRLTGHGAAVRILCQDGALTGYTDSDHGDPHGFLLDPSQSEDRILNEIKERIAAMGGPVMLPLGTTY